jgi:hypothetical protein
LLHTRWKEFAEGGAVPVKHVTSKNALMKYLGNKANGGLTPISYFEMHAHALGDHYLGDGGPAETIDIIENFGHKKAAEQANFDEARRGEFPPFCWFQVNSRAVFFGCYSYNVARAFANWTGRGERGRAYGTTKSVQGGDAPGTMQLGSSNANDMTHHEVWQLFETQVGVNPTGDPDRSKFWAMYPYAN